MAEDFPSGLSNLPAGGQIASYRLVEEIGRGGMAVVYRARDVRLDRWVALKVLSAEFARDDAFRQRFIRESRTAAAVDHPNIIPIFDAGEAGGVLFIAMRYVGGQDVHRLLHRTGPLPAARAVGIVTQVAAALDAAHACGLVHRDVKPANMLLGGQAETGSGGDHVYLSDFGISKAENATTNLTLTGQVLGTLNYLAPEQVEGRTVDGRADGYALACAAFEMLAGTPPFHRDENLAVMWAQVSAPPPPLTAHRPDLPPAVDRVMARALAKAPADRYQSCPAFATALQEACRTAVASSRGGTVVAAPVRRGAPPTVGDVPPADRERPVPRLIPAAARDAVPGGNLPARDASQAPAAAAPRLPSPVPPSPVPPSPVPPSPVPPRPRRRGLAILSACVLILAVAAAATALHRRGSLFGRWGGAPTSGAAASSAAAPLGPAATVRAYYAAITSHNYQRAWQLGGRNAGGTEAQFAVGYRGTQRDVITSIRALGPVVKAAFTAVQTDRTAKYFAGTYTVRDGVIVHFLVHQVG